MRHRRRLELVAAGEEGVGERAVAGEQGGRFGGDLVQPRQRDAGQALGRMGLGDAEQFVEPPHPLGQRGRGEDPAAAQAGEAVDLGQAGGG